jgi:hypothetical protein
MKKKHLVPVKSFSSKDFDKSRPDFIMMFLIIVLILLFAA